MRSSLFQVFSITGVACALLGACSSEPETVDFADRTPPSLVGVSPADGATDVAIDTDIEATWDEALSSQSVGFTGLALFNAEGETVEGFLMHENNHLRFRPTNRLRHDAEYTVKTNPRLADLFGNKIEQVTWSFRTAADREPPFAPYNLSYPSVTSMATVDVSGTKDPNSWLEINGERTGVPETNSFFTVTVPLAKEGANDMTFVSVDRAGNRSSDVKISVTRDTVAPERLDALCGGNEGTPATEIGLAWQFGEESGCWIPPNPFYWGAGSLPLGLTWTPSEDTSLLVGFGPWSEQTSAASWETSNLLANHKPSSAATLRISTIDAAGNVMPGFERRIIIDTLPPELIVDDAPEPATRVSSGTLAVTKEQDSRLFVTIDGGELTADGACGPEDTQCWYPWNLPDDRTYHFAALATDAAGNVSAWRRAVTIDTQAPTVHVLPGDGATVAPDAVVQLFFDEPVTRVVASDGSVFTPVAERAGRQWTRAGGSAFTEGPVSFTLSFSDRVGNEGAATPSFNAVAGTSIAIDATEPVITAEQDTRTGKITVSGLGANALHTVLVRGSAWEDFALAMTWASEITVAADPLSSADVRVEAYAQDGTAVAVAQTDASFAAPVDSMQLGTAALFGSVAPFDGGYTLLSQAGSSSYWGLDIFGQIDESLYLFETNCATPALNDSWQPFPLAGIGGDRYVMGNPCGKTSSTANRVQTFHAYTATPGPAPRTDLQTAPAGESYFGRALDAGALYPAGGTQLVVGVPSSSHNRTYVYAETDATSYHRLLQGPDYTNSGFGTRMAIAASPFDSARLAVLATGEQAVYLYEGSALAATGPVAWHQRIPVRVDETCRSTSDDLIPVRLDIVNVGDIDGDWRDDLVVAGFLEMAGANGRLDCMGKIGLWVLFGDEAGLSAPLRIDTRRLDADALTSASFTIPPQLRALGDLNGDGYADFGFIEPVLGVLRVFYGNAGGYPEERRLALVDDDPGLHWLLFGTVDENDDGLPDPVVGRVTADPEASPQRTVVTIRR